MRLTRGAIITFAMAAVGLALTARVHAADTAEKFQRPFHNDSFFVVSPLAGWNKNELFMPARGPMPAMTLTDTEPEYGLFALFVHPRVVINNMFFMTEASGSDISGNVAFINIYGKPEKSVTWNVGAGYVWHEIESARNKIEITVPMVKAGVVLRVPKMHVSLNPYLAYAQEEVETTFSKESTDALLYGITAKWQWRMLHTTLKYYYQDNLDSSEGYNVLRLRAMLFANEHLGATARVEYMEQATTDNTSLLLGPVFIF